MKQFAEFVPILIFVVVYYVADIFYATAALMIAVTLQVGALWALRRSVSQQLKLTFALSLVFGALTLIFQDRTFIQWKPTIINWLLAGVLIGSQYVGERNALQRMLGGQLNLPAAVWRRVNAGWAVGFLLSGALNLFVAYRFSEEFWVNYKLFGGFALTLLYIGVTIVYLHQSGHLEDTSGAGNDTERPR